ncbi:hypothetical protein [Desulfofundulus sp.]|uniref:hypothetical protein n=1 Tax=Desulfofundulus sp. TaxID=2282750 RepID=UPI003C76213C
MPGFFINAAGNTSQDLQHEEEAKVKFSGATDTGMTTCLRAIRSAVNEKVIVLEDDGELFLQKKLNHDLPSKTKDMFGRKMSAAEKIFTNHQARTGRTAVAGCASIKTKRI